MRGEQPRRRLALLHPGLDRRKAVELVRARAAGAVPHARDHEQAQETGGGRCAHRGLDLPVIGDGIVGREQGVGPAMVHDDLAAAGVKRLQVGIVGTEGRAHVLLQDRDVVVRIEGLRRPSGIVRHLQDHRPGHRGAVGARQDGGRRRAIGVAGIEAHAAGALVGAIDQPHPRDLRPGQAAIGVSRRALQLRRIEVAPGGIHHPVPDPILGVAARQGGVDDQLELAGRKLARRIQRLQPVQPEPPRLQLDEVEGRRAGDDAVIVARVLLGLGEALPAARGTAVVIVEFGWPAVIGGDDLLGNLGHQVVAPVAEIDHPLGMAVDPGGVEEALGGLVAGVGGGHGEAPLQAVAHGREVDRTGQAAVADAKEAAVPVLGQPELEGDLGLDRPLHPAEGHARHAWVGPGHHVENRWGEGEPGVGGDGLGGVDPEALDLQPRELGAVPCPRRGPGRGQSDPALRRGGGREREGERRRARNARRHQHGPDPVGHWRHPLGPAPRQGP